MENLLLKIELSEITFSTAMFPVSGLGRGNFPLSSVATPLVGISQVGISRFSIDHCIIYFASAGPKFLAKGPNWARGPKVGWIKSMDKKFKFKDKNEYGEKHRIG